MSKQCELLNSRSDFELDLCIRTLKSIGSNGVNAGTDGTDEAGGNGGDSGKTKCIFTL